MSTVNDALIIYRLLKTPLLETIGAIIEFMLLSTGIMMKWDRYNKKSS